jgi:hypothetical protein
MERRGYTAQKKLEILRLRWRSAQDDRHFIENNFAR